VGIVAVYHVADGPQDIFKRITETMPPPQDGFGVRWIGLIFLSGAAILCLPRQFQVTVVENVEEKHLFTAADATTLHCSHFLGDFHLQRRW